MPRRKKSILDKIEAMTDVDAIKYLLKEMKELIIKAGVSEKLYRSYPKIEEERLREVRHFLTEFYIREYSDYKRVYNSVPEHVWENYKLQDIKDMNEQIVLEEKSKLLKRAWNGRPKKRKVVKHD